MGLAVDLSNSIMNMQQVLFIFSRCLLVAMSLVMGFWMTSTSSQPLPAAQYEIKITWGSSSSRVHSSFSAAPGEQIQIELGRDVPTMYLTVWPLSDRDYDLQLALAPRETQTTPIVALNRAHRGIFSSPIELEADVSEAMAKGRGLSVSVHRLGP